MNLNNIEEARWKLAKDLEKSVAEEYGLRSYEDWKAWLLADQAKYGNNDYPDNWLFFETEDVCSELRRTIDAYGQKWYLYKTTRRHKICGKTFEAYEIFYDRKRCCCQAICGYMFEEELAEIETEINEQAEIENEEEENGCNHCSRQRGRDLPDGDSYEGFIISDGAIWYIDAEGTHGLDINFCPMCGRPIQSEKEE